MATRKRTNSAALFAEAAATADVIHEQDQAVAAKAAQERVQKTKLPLKQIKSRETDTRPSTRRMWQTWRSQLRH